MLKTETLILDWYNGFCLKVRRSLNRNKRTVTFVCEVEATKSIKPISKNAQSLPKFLIIPDELMHFVILTNAFHKGTCKHESKTKSSDEIAIILVCFPTRNSSNMNPK